MASLLVIAQRNPIYSVLLLIASFGALSGLYVLLDAPFVAVIQIIVYAGAIMVLFLFVVMLLNAPHEATEAHRLFGRRPMIVGSLLAVLLAIELVWALTAAGGESGAFPGASVSSVAEIGRLLSGGERQMLAIAGALMSRAEPSSCRRALARGLRPVVVQDLTRRLLAVRDELGIAILLVEQSAAAALDHRRPCLCDGERPHRARRRPRAAQEPPGRAGVSAFGQASGERRSYRAVKQYRRSRRWYG